MSNSASPFTPVLLYVADSANRHQWAPLIGREIVPAGRGTALQSIGHGLARREDQSLLTLPVRQVLLENPGRPFPDNAAQVVAPVEQWSFTDTVTDSSRAASANQPAPVGVGGRHVVTSVWASLAAGAALTAVYTIELIIGGVPFWRAFLRSPANGTASVGVSGLAILATVQAGANIKFSAAGGAGELQTVTVTGYTIETPSN